MKRLYIIVMSMLMLWMWFTFAADFDVSVTPDIQNAISGTTVSFNVSVSNNTWFDAYVTQPFPSQIDYSNASIVPINNPALILWLETTPRWLLLSGQSLNIQVDGLVDAIAFGTLNVFSNVVDVNNFANVYTSAIANIEPISDVIVTKTLVWDEPQLTGDSVIYNIEVTNIGSKIATGIGLVDVWPESILTFPNQWLVNGVVQVPTIYNSLLNNYLFSINDLMPGASALVKIVWSMDTMFPGGQTFTNESFVLVESDQYSTTNDSDSITNNVRWVADIYVTKIQTSANPTVEWDEIEYLISYGNSGDGNATGVIVNDVLPNVISFVSASLDPTAQVWNNISWNMWLLAPGQNGQIVVTGSFLWWVAVWSEFVNNVQISTTDFEINTINNSDLASGTVLELSDLSVELYANNLTDHSRDFSTGTQIFAVSGDTVRLQILVNNNGNVLETGTASISNINGFVNYAGLTSWDISVPVWGSQTVTLEWVVGPQGYISFAPVANLSYDTLLVNDNVTIEEPLVCGDGLITQDEVCDTNGQIWNILPWQHCEEQNGQCVLVTDNIINTVTMSYVTDLWTGHLSASVTADYQELDDVQCSALTSPYGVVILDDGLEWNMDFTCTTVDGKIADEIKIDCGNGDEWEANATDSFTYNCKYDEDDLDKDHEVQCFVNNDTNDDCNKLIRVDEWFYGVCGDGELDDGEECDYEWKEDDKMKIGRYLNDKWEKYESDNDEGNYCKWCKIRNNEGYVYQPPQCLWVDTTISVMENELMPFRWRLRERDNLKVRKNYNCEDIDGDEKRTIIDKDSMKCTFAIYNWVDFLQEDDDAANKFTVDCFQKDDSMFFNYFEDTYKVDFDKVSGRYIRSVNSLFDGNRDTYGEYKLVLEEVNYKYCNPDTQEWTDWKLFEWICEINFALTKPYLMQISTFGLDPIATDAWDFLKDFYDMRWKSLIDSTDIRDTMDVETRDYGFDTSVSTQMDSFKNKYESLSIAVDSNFEVRDGDTIWELFNNAEVKKVPNKMIFFVKGEGQLTLKQLTEYFPWIPFTIYVEGMDVIVEWSVKTNGMIITDQKMYFEDDPSQDYCEDGGQIVQWIFIAQWGFDADDTRLRNQKDQERCQRGNLQVKWVLIWDDLGNLMKNRRSHLNEWFKFAGNSKNALARERKNEIFEGAALLIEYNPDLWTSLPPGADSFTQTLDVYKN